MSIERVFLGSGRHCLHAVVDHLETRFPSTDNQWDLEPLLLLLPGSRAARRLGSLLRERAAAGNLQLIAPTITTLGRLPERVLVPRLETASTMAEVLGWVSAIRAADRPVLERLLGRRQFVQGEASDESIESMADRLASMASEVAGGGLSFQEVVEHDVMQTNPDALRWRDLASLQQWQCNWLHDNGLEGRDVRFRAAIEGDVEIIHPRHVGIISADMNALQRQLLETLASRGSEVFAMIHADDSMADAFDEHGCVDPEAWRHRTIDIDDEVQHVADSPDDQVACIVDLLGSMGGLHVDDVSIGVSDAKLLPHCHRILPSWGVPMHDPSGVRMDRTRIGRLLSTIERFLEGGQASEFATLLRDPIFERWALEQGGDAKIDLLDAFDRYRQDCLPMELEHHLPEDHVRLARVLRPCLERLELLQGEPMDVSGCVDLLEPLLLELLAPSMELLEEDDRRVLGDLGRTLEELLHLSCLIKDVTCAALLRMVRRAFENATLSRRADEPSVELLGWLDCHLDDAQTLLLAGCNEGMLPKSLESDAFLPNELRRALGLVDDDRRWARDAYLLQATLHSGREVHVVSGRRALDGDALAPSRLLLTGESTTIARRIMAFTGGSVRFQSDAPATSSTTTLERCPVPTHLPAVDTLSVTAFADYLTCPYRFMLKHVLGIKLQEDEPEELTALAFGSLAHDVLEAFGRTEMKEAAPTTDSGKIKEILDAALDHEIKTRFGRSLLPTVTLQVNLLRWRLHEFARRQADQARAGWKIARVELSFGHESSRRTYDHLPVPFPGRESMLVRGRIDRVDVHEDGQRIRVLDYKTGNSHRKPAEVHRKSDQWVNLQLPLYRHLVQAAGFDIKHCELGYVNLPSTLEKVDFQLATWTQDDYDTADVAAVSVIDGVLAGAFAPSETAPPFHDDWGRICGTSVIDLEDIE
ncbi:MAG: PD-(D/E)XK nuclease family protein [Phycisphaerales bacterium]|nr:PD-(D/E)XK nuclease family protein [Phycisphaerales bacterium]